MQSLQHVLRDDAIGVVQVTLLGRQKQSLRRPGDIVLEKIKRYQATVFPCQSIGFCFCARHNSQSFECVWTLTLVIMTAFGGPVVPLV